MTDEEYEKKVQGTKLFCCSLAVLFGIGVAISFVNGDIVRMALSICFLILLYLFYTFTKQRKIAGPIIGIILGILYILELNIVGIIIGILILVDCIPMLKYVKDINKK